MFPGNFHAHAAWLRWLIFVLVVLLLVGGGVILFASGYFSFQRNSPGLEVGGGWLAYIGADGNVYLTSPLLQNSYQLTNDASVPYEGENGRSYHRLSWSRDGWLAFAVVERLGVQARSQLFAVQVSRVQANAEPIWANTLTRLLGADDEQFVIYISWAPQPCTGGDECHHLAYLIREGEDIGLRLVELVDGVAEDRLLLVGRPTYLAWTPDGAGLLAHSGGPRPRDTENRLTHFSAPAWRSNELQLAPGFFPAPTWALDGSGWLAVAQIGDQGYLQRYTAGAEGGYVPLGDPLAASSDEFVFTLSPDGSRVAYSTRAANSSLAYEAIQVYDLASGQTRRLTPASLPVLAFFWSPGGDRLAYLTRLQVGGETWMQWRVYSLPDDRDRGFASFRPAPAWNFLMQSFNQYAQSHRFWSPDGRYLVFVTREDDFQDRIKLVDTRSENSTTPITVAAGSLASWSWR